MNPSHLFLLDVVTTSDPPAMSPSEVAARASFVVLWPSHLPEVRTELGFVALIDDNPRLHDPTAWSAAAQYLISPAHGEEYDWEGNCIGGPCPRGLDRYAVQVEDGEVVVDLSRRLPGRQIGGPPQGTPSPHPPFVPWGRDG